MNEFAGAKAEVLNRLENLPGELAVHAELAKSSVSRLFDHAARQLEPGCIFISTGDIDAMWLRDSSFQVKPLLRFAKHAGVRRFVEGVIRQQAKYISIDPYANAFNESPNGNGWHKDFEDQSPWVFERKWEIDSLASFLDLSLGLVESSVSRAHLDDEWWRAAETVVSVFERETEHDPESYVLIRPKAPKHDWLYPDGRGSAFRNCGLIWSGFRPSDDACELAFNVAQNAYAAAQLERLATAAPNQLAIRSLKLARQIRSALAELAIINGRYVYELDGLGNSISIDDANIPSLLSLPYLGFCGSDDDTYLNTRRFVLSNDNPWFFSGAEVSHIGSPHTGTNRVWPLAMAMEIITSQELELEKLHNLAQLAKSSGGFHESVNTDNVSDFTREWFSWAEMTYVDAVFKTEELLLLS